MHRFIERLAAAGLWIGGAQRCRRQHAERAGQHRRHIGQNIAEQIVGDDDIVLLGPADKLHAAIVGEHMFERHIGIGLPVYAGHDLIP